MNSRATRRPLVLAALALALACGQAAGQEKLPVTVPERVVVPVGGTTDFTVTLDREALEGGATVELRGLPKGVTITKGDGVIARKADSTSFALLAADTVPGEQDHTVTVRVTAGDTVEEAKLTLHTEKYTMTGVSWVIMLISVGSVLTLVTFCLIRVLSLPPTEEEHLRGPLEIDTGDTRNAD